MILFMDIKYRGYMVFYFSGTGNSKYIAKRIAKDLNEDLVNIVDCLFNGDVDLSFKEDEKIGIVFPTYYFGPPLIIEEFFKFLEATNILNEDINNRYFYIVYNYEATGGGIEFKISNSLKKKNLNLKYISSVKMPNNFSIYYNLPSKEEEQKTLDLAEHKIDSVINEIKERKEIKANKDLMGRIVSFVMYPIYKYGRKTRRFYANDKCINCTLCERVCPVNAIKMKDQKPEWIKKKCEYCLACYNRCPVDAIQVGNWTINRRRYYNLKGD